MFAYATEVPTDRQREVLAFLTQYIDAHGLPPTLTEIAAAVGVRHRSTAHALLQRLLLRGLVERTTVRSVPAYQPRELAR